VRLLLDTHIWVWSLLDPARLSPRVRELLSSTSSELWLSSISIWEFTLLVEKGRLELEHDIDSWLDRAFELAPMREAPLSHAIVRTLGAIHTPHPDPADRFLAATAAALELDLVTADERLLRGRGYRTIAGR
jgi:PIN domain nuclease of toxin-antitoxin system